MIDCDFGRCNPEKLLQFDFALLEAVFEIPGRKPLLQVCKIELQIKERTLEREGMLNRYAITVL